MSDAATTTRQRLTIELRGTTAGSYLTWVRDPKPPALDRELASIAIEAEPLGPTITAVLEWTGEPPSPRDAAAAAGLPITEDVRAVFANQAGPQRPQRSRTRDGGGVAGVRPLTPAARLSAPAAA